MSGWRLLHLAQTRDWMQWFIVLESTHAPPLCPLRISDECRASNNLEVWICFFASCLLSLSSTRPVLHMESIHVLVLNLRPGMSRAWWSWCDNAFWIPRETVRMISVVSQNVKLHPSIHSVFGAAQRMQSLAYEAREALNQVSKCVEDIYIYIIYIYIYNLHQFTLCIYTIYTRRFRDSRVFTNLYNVVHWYWWM